ncbi:MAG TPA: hypothetical protein VK991_14930, partial [Halomonas sp.]|nr:hypothetical protein [Halomonas sp.]
MGHHPRVARVLEPVATPKAQRKAEDEGHYIQSVLPVRVEVDLPEGETWQRLVWLHHMRYPKYPDQTHRPVTVDVPTVGEVRIAFSRQRYQLPFAMALRDFTMTPYEGSNIPRD